MKAITFIYIRTLSNTMEKTKLLESTVRPFLVSFTTTAAAMRVIV
jgi:hypothetical protein